MADQSDNIELPRWYYDQLKQERDAMRRDMVKIIDAYDSMAGQLESFTSANSNMLQIAKQVPRLLSEGTLTDDFVRLREILDQYRDADPDDPQKLDEPNG